MTDPVRRPGQYKPQSASDKLAQEALAMDEAEEQSNDAEKKADDKKEPDLSPIERWRANLAEAKITEDEAEAILDTMLEKGYWEKEYTLFRGKVKILFRTRDQHAVNKVRDALDNIRTNDARVHFQTVNRLNLAGSLLKYRDRVFKFPSTGGDLLDVEKGYDERLKFIDHGGIPGPILDQVYVALGRFDQIVYAALSEGATSGF